MSLDCISLLTEPRSWASSHEREEERLSFESPGFISGCRDMECGRRCKYGLREVVDLEVLARGKCWMDLFMDGFDYSCFTLLPLELVFPRNDAHCLDLL